MPSPEIDLIKRDNPLERVMGELGRATPAEWLREAIAETGAKGSKSWKYTKAIIERWRLHGRTPRARTSSANPPAGQRGRASRLAHPPRLVRALQRPGAHHRRVARRGLLVERRTSTRSFAFSSMRHSEPSGASIVAPPGAVGQLDEGRRDQPS